MAPPPPLVRSLVDGPSLIAGLEWHEEVGSTNEAAAAAAARGVPEVHAVLANRQTAGRGRQGRSWHAPPGGSLLLSLVVRPLGPGGVDPPALPLLPLLTGVALAQAVQPFCPRSAVGLKWPNDLLVGGCKAGGILVEVLPGGACVVGVGLNVDWRGAARPPALAGATSLAEAAGAPVDRWRVLAALAGVFGNHYGAWRTAPAAFLGAYRERCVTVGRQVRVTRPRRSAVEGLAAGVDDDGRLAVRLRDGATLRLSAGDVEHVRAK